MIVEPTPGWLTVMSTLFLHADIMNMGVTLAAYATLCREADRIIP